MFLACYTRRQTKRQELAIETILEKQLEGEIPPAHELAAPAVLANVEQLFVPLQRRMTAQAADGYRARFPEYTWVNADLPGHTLLDPKLSGQSH